jgi:hypothetical protein
MKVIPVNRGEYIYEAQVDDGDYEFLSQFRWRASVNKTTPNPFSDASCAIASSSQTPAPRAMARLRHKVHP